MKSKLLVTIVILVIVSTTSFYAQDDSFKVHTVKKNETLDMISRMYNCPKEDIIRLNPDIVSTIKQGDLLIVRNNYSTSLLIESIKKDSENIEKDLNDVVKDGFIFHSVRKKETKYGISKKYNVSIQELIDHNPSIIDGLRYKDIIKIPLNTVNRPLKNYIDKKNIDEYKVHEIKQGETVWRICHNYKISKDELLEINPFISERFDIGDTIFIPKSKIAEINDVDSNYTYYEVQPKDTKFKISTKFEIPITELDSLNPEIKKTLKSGMVIKIPKKQGNITPYNKNLDEIDIALMLPFYYDKNISEINKSDVDSSKLYDKTNIAVDFYFGAVQAIDDFKSKNPNKKVNLKVFDTQNSIDRIQEILDNNNFDSIDFVVGPMYASNVEFLASALDYKNIPVISPLSDKHTLSKLTNVIQIMPTDFIFQNSVLNKMIEEYDGQSIVIAGSMFDINKIDFVKNKLSSSLTKDSLKMKFIIQKDDVLVLDSLKSIIDTNRSNVVIVTSKDPILISNIVSISNYLNSEEKGIQNKVYCLEHLNGLKHKKLVSSIPVDYFSETNFVYPVNYFIDNNSPPVTNFNDKYLKSNHRLATKYSYMGYDIINFSINKIIEDRDIFTVNNKVYNGITSNFKIEKKISGCYYNSEVTLIRFSKTGIPYIVK